jgi:CAAD domains of cyanobacterial aminoacyl-tRNA synthetase
MTEITQFNEDGAISTEIVSANTLLDSESANINEMSAGESAEQFWQSFQAKTTAFFNNITKNTAAFLKSNQQLLSTLGFILLALLGFKVVFAIMGVIEEIPFVTPLLKLIGLVYVVRFVWRYLIREQDRQELIQTLNRTKVEVLGG